MDIPLREVADGWIQCYRGRGGGDGIGNKFPPKFKNFTKPRKYSDYHMNETYPTRGFRERGRLGRWEDGWMDGWMDGWRKSDLIACPLGAFAWGVFLRVQCLLCPSDAKGDCATFLMCPLACLLETEHRRLVHCAWAEKNWWSPRLLSWLGVC